MPDRKPFDAWVTKYALTKGVLKVKARQYDANSIAIEVGVTGRLYRGTIVRGDDWHLSATCALERSERMRLAKIASLEKQIAKLKELRLEAA